MLQRPSLTGRTVIVRIEGHFVDLYPQVFTMCSFEEFVEVLFGGADEIEEFVFRYSFHMKGFTTSQYGTRIVATPEQLKAAAMTARVHLEDFLRQKLDVHHPFNFLKFRGLRNNFDLVLLETHDQSNTFATQFPLHEANRGGRY